MTEVPCGTHAPDLDDFGDTITRMDALSQAGFSAVAVIAKRALASIERSPSTLPSTLPSHEALANALRAIWGKAELFGNDINVEAEAVGCNYVSERLLTSAIHTRA